MLVLDLFSGSGGWSAAFADRGHDVYRMDTDLRLPADGRVDIGDVAAVLESLPWRPDVVLASPPCNSFSTMTMGRMWTPGGEPKHPTAAEGQRLVLATIRIIAALRPRAWIIENPRARLRTLGLLDGLERRTVWYCRLGERRAKPTDLWGGFPPTLELPEPCRNGHPDHIRAPRGSRGGTQGGVDAVTSGSIPYALSERVALACERMLAGAEDVPPVGQLRLLRPVG